MTMATSSRWQRFTRADGLGARVLRSSALTVLGFGGSQVLRLASNLILTRLLFPEAFGIMGLVWIFLVGLNNFSDLGINASIIQNKRGDEPAFLNTAWTLQIMRGVILWLVTLALAAPVAQFYDAPQLAELLPVVGLTLLVTGFNPTRVEQANRHLKVGQLTVIDLIAQVIGLVVGVVIAWVTGSVWALVINAMTASVVQLVLYTLFLPGSRNRLGWEKPAMAELLRFGSWIFLATVAGFLVSQGDKIILGKYLSLNALGVYTIGYFLASFPLQLGGTVIRRILIPAYRERPPKDSAENFKQLQKLRFIASSSIFALLAIVTFAGVPLVNLLYDSRYALAGGVVVLLSLMQIPMVIVLTYDQAALASGDSRRFFVLAGCRAVLMLAGLLIGVEAFGLMGALIGQGVAMVLAYPVVVWLARHQGSWDPLHDGLFAVVGLSLVAVSLWLNFDAITKLSALNLP